MFLCPLREKAARVSIADAEQVDVKVVERATCIARLFLGENEPSTRQSYPAKKVSPSEFQAGLRERRRPIPLSTNQTVVH